MTAETFEPKPGAAGAARAPSAGFLRFHRTNRPAGLVSREITFSPVRKRIGPARVCRGENKTSPAWSGAESRAARAAGAQVLREGDPAGTGCHISPPAPRGGDPPSQVMRWAPAGAREGNVLTQGLRAVLSYPWCRMQDWETFDWEVYTFA